MTEKSDIVSIKYSSTNEVNQNGIHKSRNNYKYLPSHMEFLFWNVDLGEGHSDTVVLDS